jgi:DNA polymerase I-like protein with 3'-5' exonuclease and polymerase domains
MSQLQISLKEKKFYKKDYFVRFPDHLHYFIAVSLKSLLHKSQFEFVDGIADFSIGWFISNKHSNYAVNSQLGIEAHHARVYLESYIN